MTLLALSASIALYAVSLFIAFGRLALGCHGNILVTCVRRFPQLLVLLLARAVIYMTRFPKRHFLNFYTLVLAPALTLFQEGLLLLIRWVSGSLT